MGWCHAVSLFCLTLTQQYITEHAPPPPQVASRQPASAPLAPALQPAYAPGPAAPSPELPVFTAAPSQSSAPGPAVARPPKGIAVGSAVCPSGRLYVVKPGNTLFLIAQAYNLTVHDIVFANSRMHPRLSRDPDNIEVGEKLCLPSEAGADVTIPAVPTYAAAPNCTKFSPPMNCRRHEVHPRETLGKIAEANDIPLDYLLAANPQILEPGYVPAGYDINIPYMPQTRSPVPAPAPIAKGANVPDFGWG